MKPKKPTKKTNTKSTQPAKARRKKTKNPTLEYYTKMCDLVREGLEIHQPYNRVVKGKPHETQTEILGLLMRIDAVLSDVCDLVEKK